MAHRIVGDRQQKTREITRGQQVGDHDGNGAQGKTRDDIDIDKKYGPRSESDKLVAGSPPRGSRLSGKKLPSGMTGSSSLSKGPGALPLTALRVRERVFSRTFLSFFAGTVAGVPLEAGTARVAEFRLDTRPNSSEWSVLGLWGLRVEVVVRERENRLGMEGFDPNDGQKEKGRSETTGDRRLFRALAFPLALSACPNPDGNTRHPSLRPHSPTQITSTATATATTGYHSSRTAFLTVPLIFFLFFSPFFPLCLMLPTVLRPTTLLGRQAHHVSLTGLRLTRRQILISPMCSPWLSAAIGTSFL
jgi:hypothetical protein